MAGVHGLGPEDAVLMPAPMAHISGLLNGVLVPGAAGLRSVLVRRFDPEQALALVARERISFLAGPPTFFIAMAGTCPRRGTRDRRLVGAARLERWRLGHAGVRRGHRAWTFDCRVKRTYGSTEAPTVTTSTDDDSFEKARDTDGRAVGEVELRVSDPETGVPLVTGTAGELWVRGPEMFAGYADAAQTAAVIARGGWFRTGDLATVDEDGWVRIVGRLKDVIIRGGENISASEVEAASRPTPTSDTPWRSATPTRSWVSGWRRSSSRPPHSISKSAGVGSPAAAWRPTRHPSAWSSSNACLCSGRARLTAPRCDAGPLPADGLRQEGHHRHGVPFAGEVPN